VSIHQRDRSEDDPASRAGRWARVALGLVFGAVLVLPHLARVRHPSLFGDDLMRVRLFQDVTLGEALYLPFNEHMAPLFDALTWGLWRSAGRRLVNAPVGFTMAALVPYALTLAALGRAVGRGLGRTAAGVAVAVFAVSPLHQVETVWWYSGSNHMWALLFTVLAIDAVSAPGPVGPWGSALAALLAPAGSAMGFLAGPAAAVRAWAAPREPGRSRLRAWRRAAAPLAGTALFLAASTPFGYARVLSSSVRVNTNLADGLMLVARAPADALLPALVGGRIIDGWFRPGVDAGLGVGLLVAGLVWAYYSRQSAWALTGLTLIFGAYLLIFPFRSVEGQSGAIRNARYHLFPQCGLAVLCASAGASWWRRLDARPVAGPAVVAGLAVALLGLHAEEYRRGTELYRFPDQPAVLAALERAGEIGRERGITREQLAAALEPTTARWADLGNFTLPLLIPPTGVASRVPDREARSVVLNALTPSEREALCGGMDAGPYLRPTSTLRGLPTLAVGRPAGSSGMTPSRTPEAYRSAGWPSYLEFEMVAINPPDPAGPFFLSVPARDPNSGLEVWWAPEDGDWSPTRRVRWQANADARVGDWSVPLAALPHWDGSRARRIRLVFRYRGPVAAGPPRLLGPTRRAD